MNTKLLLLVISVAAFSSCTTLYKSGQTPDDVYYSPVRPANNNGYVEQKKEQQPYQPSGYYSEERSIRLGIYDPRWRYLDDYNYSNSLYVNDYSYSPYNYGFNYGYYYNPYYWPYPVYSYYPVTVKSYNPKVTTPRMTSLSTYNHNYNNSPIITNHGSGIRPSRTYNNSNRGSAVGNVMRQVFTPTNNSSNSTNNNSTYNRTYTPSSSTSSSSSAGSSSSGGGGGISRPPRN